MCVIRLPRTLGQVVVFMFAEKRLRQSILDCRSFFVSFFGAVPLLLPRSRNRQIAHWSFPKIFRKPVFESPPASGNILDFFVLTGRYHPARHENNTIFHGGR